MGEKIRRLRDLLGESQAEFGARFGVEQATVSRWERGEPVARRLQAEVARAAGMTVADFFYSPSPVALIPLIGEAETEDVTLYPDAATGRPLQHSKIEMEGGEQVSVRVKGGGLLPHYRDGDLLFGARLRGAAIETAIGKECIVKLASGDGLVRVLLRDADGAFRLRSLTPFLPDIEGARLDWVAPIQWVRRA